MLLQFHLNSRYVLRLCLILGLLWFVLDFILDRRPFDFTRHVITDYDITEARAIIQALNDPGQFQLLSSSLTHRFCRAHNYFPFHTSSSIPRRKVYELLLINTELDWLEVQLLTLYDHVDYFVVVEAAKTFTGHPKRLYVKESWTRFSEWHSKIIYHELVFPDNWNPPRAWEYENLQRDSAFTQVFPTLKGKHCPRYGDVIIVADVDEIPRPATVALLRSCHFPMRLTLRSQFYYYSFQFRHRSEEWTHPQATLYTTSWSTLKPFNLRNGGGGIPFVRDLDKGDLWNAAWHCRLCFANISDFLNQMESFSHKSLNKPKFRKPDLITERVRQGKDLWDRPGEIYDKIDGNQDVPAPLLDDTQRWKYMLDRSGESAGFSDYS